MSDFLESVKSNFTKDVAHNKHVCEQAIFKVKTSLEENQITSNQYFNEVENLVKYLREKGWKSEDIKIQENTAYFLGKLFERRKSVLKETLINVQNLALNL